MFYHESGEVLAQFAQRGGRCPVPGNIQGQVRQGFEQSDQVGRCPCSVQGGWTR